MIIRKKVKSNSSDGSSSQKNKKTNVIKKEDVILDAKNIKDTAKNPPKEIIAKEKLEQADKIEEFEKIDITSIEFKERIERRRGDRRRGYRRIDERSLVSRAQQEAHTIKELAAREGYQNGLARAKEEIANFKNEVAVFLDLKDEMYEKIYPHIIEISLCAARKIIKKEIEQSDEILKQTVVSALDEFNSDIQKVEIKVNPDDYEFALASIPEIIEAKAQGVRVSVTKDETITKGSCIIIANNGVIDANFSVQLAVLQSAFGIYEGGL